MHLQPCFFLLESTLLLIATFSGFSQPHCCNPYTVHSFLPDIAVPQQIFLFPELPFLHPSDLLQPPHPLINKPELDYDKVLPQSSFSCICMVAPITIYRYHFTIAPDFSFFVSLPTLIYPLLCFDNTLYFQIRGYNHIRTETTFQFHHQSAKQTKTCPFCNCLLSP